MTLAGFSHGGGRLVYVSWALLVLTGIHALIGIILTIKTVYTAKKAGVFYLSENMLFFVRRISGLALVIFIAIHAFIFMGVGSEAGYTLKLFDLTALVSQILMVITLFLHLCTNIAPLRIALGLSDKRDLKMDVVIVISILLFICAAAFLVYYIRWKVI